VTLGDENECVMIKLTISSRNSFVSGAVMAYSLLFLNLLAATTLGAAGSDSQANVNIDLSRQKLYARLKSSPVKDLNVVVEQLRRAADGGDPTSQCALAVYYLEGTNSAFYALPNRVTVPGILEDTKLFGSSLEPAMELLIKAAKGGSIEAAFCLAVIYNKGKGVKEAGKLFESVRSAAEAGDSLGEYYLSQMFQYREGVPDSNRAEQTVFWLRKAAEQGLPSAEFALSGKLGASPEAISEVISLIRKAAEAGIDEAQWELGRLYEAGMNGVDQNFNEALKWFTAAAEQGLFAAEEKLVEMYTDGTQIKKNPGEADNWSSKMADHGAPEQTLGSGRGRLGWP